MRHRRSPGALSLAKGAPFAAFIVFGKSFPGILKMRLPTSPVSLRDSHEVVFIAHRWSKSRKIFPTFFCVTLRRLELLAQNHTMKYFRAELGGIEPWLWLNHGHLEERHRGWTQQPEHWTLFFLEHAGGFSVGNHTFPFDDGDVALVAPGARVGFVGVGQETLHYTLTFSLRPRVEIVALPAVANLGEKRELRRQEVRDAEKKLTFSIGRGLAFAYNLLWDIALPPDVLGRSTIVQDFDRLVTQRLAEKLSVPKIAAELGISGSQLLRLVRAECGMTVQEFIREKRTETARNLIASSDLTLKAIAAKTGMPDLQYFNKAIRAASGLSPRALRDLATNRTRHV